MKAGDPTSDGPGVFGSGDLSPATKSGEDFGQTVSTRGPATAGVPAARLSALAVNRAIAENRSVVVVDVRSAEDYAKGHVPGAVNLPRDKWASAEGLSKEKVNVVYCYSHACQLGGAACALLAGTGYPVVEMDGGFDVWQMSDLEIER